MLCSKEVRVAVQNNCLPGTCGLASWAVKSPWPGLGWFKYEPLFGEEGGGAPADGKEDAAVVQAEEIDRMLFIQVTVYPPGYDPAETEDDALQPRSAWTAVFFPPDEEEGGAGGTTR